MYAAALGSNLLASTDNLTKGGNLTGYEASELDHPCTESSRVEQLRNESGGSTNTCDSLHHWLGIPGAESPMQLKLAL
jgi:hypothetical protein